jgi:cysteine dioxygenase
MDPLIDRLREAVSLWRLGTAPGAHVVETLQEWHQAVRGLEPWVRYDPVRYQRRRIYGDGDIEILLLCWDRGQATPVHDHDGQSGWFTVLAGTLAVQEFERRGGPADLGEIGPGGVLPPGSLNLHPREPVQVPAGLTVCEAAAPETIHKVGSDGERALSLHVYARPLESFLVFDEALGSCRRLSLEA